VGEIGDSSLISAEIGVNSEISAKSVKIGDSSLNALI